MRNENMNCNAHGWSKCDIDKSASFPDGVCINCGQVCKSSKTVIDLMKIHINLYSDNFELFDDLAQLMRENKVVIPDQEIRNICTHWYKCSKPTRERLSNADELFLILTRTNEENIQTGEPTVTMGYKNE